jgi:hypothetical protein
LNYGEINLAFAIYSFGVYILKGFGGGEKEKEG